MNDSILKLESTRIGLVLFATLLGGLLSGEWLLSLIVALLAYIGWSLYKLQQFYHWLERGAKASQVPDSDGVWERICYQIQRRNQKSRARKQRMSILLKRMQRIIKGLPYATVVLNGNNEIDWANKYSTQLLGIEAGRDRGQRIDNLVRLPKLHKVLEKGKDREIEIDSPRDYNIKLSLQLLTIHSDLKLLIARDISERVHFSEMRKSFISNASHELRTPLTVISGYLEMLGQSEELPESLVRMVESSEEQSTRMRNIIEDLLALSRLESSDLQEDTLQPIDIAQIVDQLCRDQLTLFDQEKQINREIDGGIQLLGVETEIASLCSNLIHNAIRYNPEGTRVDVRWQRDSSGGACLTVQDYGDGIAEKHLAHLTERFYRVDQGRSRAQGGTGLGLAIVLHIVQRHRGRLEVDSVLGEGSTFSAHFPAQQLYSSVPENSFE